MPVEGQQLLHGLALPSLLLLQPLQFRPSHGPFCLHFPQPLQGGTFMAFDALEPLADAPQPLHRLLQFRQLGSGLLQPPQGLRLLGDGMGQGRASPHLAGGGEELVELLLQPVGHLAIQVGFQGTATAAPLQLIHQPADVVAGCRRH